MTTRPDERPFRPISVAPMIGTALIVVALLSLVARPWSKDSADTAGVAGATTAADSGGPTELPNAPVSETAAGRPSAGSPAVADRDTDSGPKEIEPPRSTAAGGGAADQADADVAPDHAQTALATDQATPPALPDERVTTLCQRIGAKLGSVSVDECLGFALKPTRGSSVLGAPIVSIDFLPAASSPSSKAPRVLLLGGIHGDEYSSVTIMFKWLAELEADPERRLHWRILPLLNPDGLLRQRSQRMNHRGVDLNRNFPTPNWKEDATDYWVRRTGRNPRRYPGPSPLSEPESRFLHDEIGRFEPDVIVAVHAPLKVVDFDGPNIPPDRLGSLYLRRMGTYPGSLGRYGGEHVGLPVVTIELPRAGTMPPKAEQRQVWTDLGDYLERTLLTESSANATASASGND